MNENGLSKHQVSLGTADVHQIQEIEGARFAPPIFSPSESHSILRDHKKEKEEDDR